MPNNNNLRKKSGKFAENQSKTQPCPICGSEIGLLAGSKEAICTNCGFKDPCCE